MSDYDNLKLRGRTFLDFTDVPAILDEILGGHDKADRDGFLFAINAGGTAAEQERAITFVAFADLCQDKRLAAVIKAEFAAEYSAIFNE